MDWNELDAAIRATRELRYAARCHAASMGELLVGNLRACSHDTLRALKQELAAYNMLTGKWRKS